MIVSAAIAPTVRALAATWPLGQGMWITPLYTGEELTHYISTGNVPDWILQYLPYTDYSGSEPVVYPGDLEALVTAINTANPEAGATTEGIAALLVGADISTQEWPAAIERIGLTMGAE
jgi:hypothetical protein